MIIGTCSCCGGDVVDEYRNKPWGATTPPPPPHCTRCCATAGRNLPVIPTVPVERPRATPKYPNAQPWVTPDDPPTQTMTEHLLLLRRLARGHT